jgi:hypothetical protein
VELPSPASSQESGGTWGLLHSYYRTIEKRAREVRASMISRITVTTLVTEGKEPQSLLT